MIQIQRNVCFHDNLNDISDTEEENKFIMNDIDENYVQSNCIIDFVMVYGDTRKTAELKFFDKETAEQIRFTFENNLIKEGLELSKDVCGCLTFVKIHAPISILRKYCELLRLKMPVTKTSVLEHKSSDDFNLISSLRNLCKNMIKRFVSLDLSKYYKNPTLYAEYNRDKFFLFDEKSPDFFSSTIRIFIVDFILNRTKWSENENNSHFIGIQTLIDKNVYNAAYPLHDGDFNEGDSIRKQLYCEWASLNKWIKLQPIDDIRNYFGEKCAFYFAWLGFYTQLLIPASFFGIAVFLYGFISLKQDNFSTSVCNNETIIMCPLCDKYCDYWKLSTTCLHAKITYFFDNNFTVAFAFLMSIWATFFLELWKRYSAVLSHNWGLSDYTTQAEHPRPQYLSKLTGSKKRKENITTGLVEPVLSFWFYKLPVVIFTYTIIILFILIAIAIVFSIILYRMWMNQIDALVAKTILNKFSYVFVPITAGILNLICIVLLNMVYDKVARYLTSLELPRTQTEYDDSLSIKLYIFQFVNYYSSLFYIVFLKGKFIGYPSKYNRIFGFRQEECSAGGCLIELSIQLAIIMVGQQVINSVLEMIIPMSLRRFNLYAFKKNQSSVEKILDKLDKKQWVEDYKLLDWGSQGLFSEYLEMALQFGFVTLFAAAFPLASLFALLNNIFELRLDAKKILRYYRRPVPLQIPNIGVWFRILDVIGKMAVVSNAVIIAFSSNFIPQIVYDLEKLELSFLEFSLSYFNTSDFPNQSKPILPTFNASMCRYFGYRNPPSSALKYKHRNMHWKILVARLLFILIFQNIVFIIKIAAQWLIPDIPQKLSDRIKKESRIITQLIIDQETELALNNAAHHGPNNKYLAEISLDY